MSKIYQDKVNKKIYTVIDNCKVEKNNSWVNAYVYVEGNENFPVSKIKYVKEVEDFHKMGKPVTNNKGILDGYSMLERIRNFQFSHVFMKAIK